MSPPVTLSPTAILEATLLSITIFAAPETAPSTVSVSRAAPLHIFSPLISTPSPIVLVAYAVISLIVGCLFIIKALVVAAVTTIENGIGDLFLPLGTTIVSSVTDTRPCLARQETIPPV